MRIVPGIACLAVIALLGSAPTMADDANKDAEKVIDEITDKDATVTGPSGDTEAATGEATPNESWLSCSHGDDEAENGENGHCRSEDEASAKDSSPTKKQQQ